MLGVLHGTGTNVTRSATAFFVFGQFPPGNREEAKLVRSKAQFRGSVLSIIVVFAVLVLFIVAAVISARP